MAIERMTADLPGGFDPSKHAQALVAMVVAKHGEGWELESIDPADSTATLTRQVALTEVTAAQPTSRKKSAPMKQVNLPRGTKPSDGDKISARFEDQHPGFYLTSFEPFLGRAELTKLSDEVARCRGALALALSVKPWEVQVGERPDGGFHVALPRTYVPSKHNDKMDEVATVVVGQEGWYVDIDTRALTAQIIPSDPPTFPAVIPYPFTAPKSEKAYWEIPVGRELGHNGAEGEDLVLDFDATPGALIVGTAGAGKAQPLDTPIPVPVSDRFPDGWATMGTLELGDQVFTGGGEVAPVDYLSPISEREVLIVKFSDGQEVEADAEHMWVVSDVASRIAHGARGVNKRAATRERLSERLDRISLLAEDACKVAAGASPQALGRMFGLNEQKVRVIAQNAGLPFILASGSGSARIYPVDEFALAYRDHETAKTNGQSARARRLPETRIVTTTELLAEQTGAGERNEFAVRVAPAIDTKEADLPIDPYLLGAWLGDGTARNGGVTVGDADLVEMRALLSQAWGPSRVRVETRGGSSAVSLHFGRPDVTACLNGHYDWVPVEGHSPYCRTCRVTRSSSTRFARNATFSMHLRDAGLYRNKHIPALYLRASREQRLALLQGLMDTDGTVNKAGQCEFAVCDERLARHALQLVRSLGIKASITMNDAALTEPDPTRPGSKRRRVVGVRHRVKFTTDEVVFRLPRKRARLHSKGSMRPTSRWNYVVGVERVGAKEVRCLRVNHPEHTYLTGEFIPTHNTVAINALIAGALARGWELCLGDVPHKALDFTWAKNYCRPGGWGCDSPEATLTMLKLVYQEKDVRSALLAKHGAQKLQDLPEHVRPKPILIVLDEVTGMFALEPVPKGVPKDHPLVQEPLAKNLIIQSTVATVAKIPAELRFVGIRVIIATQMAQQNTGIGVPLKTNLANRMLLGANPNEQARGHAFLDPRSAPLVPDNIKADRAASRGVGVAEFEGRPASVFKSYFATTEQYCDYLVRLRISTTPNPAPTPAQIAKHTPSLDDYMNDERPPSRLDSGGFGAGDGRDAPDVRLRGAAAAAHQLAVEAAEAKRREQAK